MNIFSFIKAKVSILDVVGHYVALKKAGHYWKGPCPFHSEKTASFTVSPHREIFYCFGCHAGGDAIAFISKAENCTQIEAAKLLADKFNLEVPETLSKDFDKNPDTKKRYFSLCQLVAEWCHEQLKKNASIENYLTKRGFTSTSIDTFMVGYFPGTQKGINALTKYVGAHQFLLQDLIDAGIVQEGKTHFSPFEERIIFPITNHLGSYCGFGGRIFKEDDERSKYYNSKENDYFQKGSLLFGLDKAKKEIQKQETVLLVEGYTDCLAMVQNGYTNTVATLGTACTLEHLKALSHHAHTLLVVYDADAAGRQASLRLATMCWQVNLEVNVVILPPGSDPASYLQEHNTLDPVIQKAQDIFVFFLTTLGENYANEPLQHKIQATRECLDVIRKLDDPLKRDILLQKAANIFGISIGSLQRELQAGIKPVAKRDVQPLAEECETISSLEKKLMYGILNDTQLLEKPEIRTLLDYIPEPLKTIVDKLKRFSGKEERELFGSFFDTLEEKERLLVHQLLLQDQQEEALELDALITQLEKKYWKTMVTTTKSRLAHAQAENNQTEVQMVVKEFLELKRRLLHKGLI